MSFQICWLAKAKSQFNELMQKADSVLETRIRTGNKKSSKQEGLFKQVYKCIELLSQNPRHPGLNSHKFNSIEDPYSKNENVFEVYVQNKTPGAYRVFWCYGPKKNEITIIAITPHP